MQRNTLTRRFARAAHGCANGAERRMRVSGRPLPKGEALRRDRAVKPPTANR
jgi:hypothetical protein